jgi:hypothetical protein
MDAEGKAEPGFLDEVNEYWPKRRLLRLGALL